MSMNKGQRGFIMPVVLFAVGFLAIVTMALLLIQRANIATTDAQKQGLNAQYAAEAGGAAALAILRNETTRKAINTTTYTLPSPPANSAVSWTSTSLSTSPITYTITSVGTITNALGTVASVTMTISAVVATNTFGRFALFSVGNMTFKNNTTISGDVASNGTIVNGNNITFTTGGHAYSNLAVGDYAKMIPGDSTVDGTKQALVDYRTYFGKGYMAPPKTSTNPLTGTPATIDSTSYNVYYADAGWTVGNNQTFTANSPTIIYVNGNLNLGNGVTFNGSSTVALIVNGTVNFGNSVNLGQCLLVSKGKVDIANDFVLTGAVVSGGTMTIKNNSVTYSSTVYANYPGLYSYDISSTFGAGSSGTTIASYSRN